MIALNLIASLAVLAGLAAICRLAFVAAEHRHVTTADNLERLPPAEPVVRKAA